jgi:hypothetical protein
MRKASIAVGLMATFGVFALGAEPEAVVTFAGSHIAVIRQTTLYSAAVGVTLRDGDIVETSEGGVQIEFPPSTLLAVASHSRVLIQMNHARSAACDTLIYSLQGLVKMARTTAVMNRWACLQAAQIRTALATGSAIQRLDGSAVSLFAEKGELMVQGAGAAAAEPTIIKVPAEQFAQWRSGQALKILARPTPEFLATLPSSFEDELTPLADRVRGAKVEPVVLREVSYGDIADWLKAMPQRLEFVHQFQPRLKDPEFRRQIDADLGRTPDWGPILHPSPSSEAVTPSAPAPTP